MIQDILINTQYFFLQPSNSNVSVISELPFSLTATNNQKFRKQRFYSDEVVTHIGTMTTSSNYDFAFIFAKIPSERESLDLNVCIKTVYDNLSIAVTYFDEFMSYLWFAKDNSASSGLSLSYIDGWMETLTVLQNVRVCTMSDGKRRDIYFSQEDINTAIEIIEKIKVIYPNEKKAKSFITPADLNEDGKITNKDVKSLDDHTHYFKFNSIQRALSLLSILRGVAFLPYKLSLYIPILESLFSPSDGELSFKVSQRVAFYIGTSTAEIKTIYDQVKRVYEIRSRFLHGQKFEKKSTKLEFKDESKNMDDILRRVLKKVILEDSSIFLGTDTEAYLNNLVFKDRQDSPKTHFE